MPIVHSGMNGQKAHLPHSRSRAVVNVSDASRATARLNGTAKPALSVFRKTALSLR